MFLKIKAILLSGLLCMSLSALSGCVHIEIHTDNTTENTTASSSIEIHTDSTTENTTASSSEETKPSKTTSPKIKDKTPFAVDDEDSELPTYSAIEIYKENGAFPDGKYAIGTEMPEGIYLFKADQTGHGVQGVYADPDCATQISAAYVHFDGSRIVEIKGNGYVDYSWCTAYDLSKHPEIVNDPHSGSGMFIVGRDIEPGTYNLIPDEGEYGDYAEWTIYSSINAVAPIIVSSGRSIANDDITITLKDGEYLETKYCRVE